MRCGHNFSGMTENHTLPEIQSGRLPVITGSDHSMPESGQDSGERIIILMAVDDIDMLAGDNLVLRKTRPGRFSNANAYTEKDRPGRAVAFLRLLPADDSGSRLDGCMRILG